MSNQTLEERVAALEQRVEKLTREKDCEAEKPWWERHYGAFKDSPYFEEAVRLGAEYRRSQPMPGDDELSDAGDVPA